MRLTRAQNVLRLAGNVQNRVHYWGSAPDPAEAAYDAPSDSLILRGFFPSAIAASRLRRLQVSVLGGGGIASITQGGWTPLVLILAWNILLSDVDPRHHSLGKSLHISGLQSHEVKVIIATEVIAVQPTDELLPRFST